MIDYIYGTGMPVEPLADPVTRAIYAYATSSPASRAAWYRRYRLADLIDSMVTQQLCAGRKDRDAGQTRALANEIDTAQINATKQYTDPDSNIHFVELQRR